MYPKLVWRLSKIKISHSCSQLKCKFVQIKYNKKVVSYYNKFKRMTFVGHEIRMGQLLLHVRNMCHYPWSLWCLTGIGFNGFKFWGLYGHVGFFLECHELELTANESRSDISVRHTCSVLASDVMKVFRRVITFHKNVLPSSAGQKLLEIKKDEIGKLFSGKNLYLVYPKFLNLKLFWAFWMAKTLEESICMWWNFVRISHVGVGKNLFRLSTYCINLML